MTEKTNEKRFNDTLQRMLKTPPKPHKPDSKADHPDAPNRREEHSPVDGSQKRGRA